MAILQIQRLNGTIISQAKWETESLRDLHVGDLLQVSLESSDKELLTWLTKTGDREIGIEKEAKSKTYSVILSFRVDRFRHMFEASSTKMDSMVVAVPMNRNIEHVLMFIVSPEHADPRFKNLIHQK